jgi:hypothetical protein
MAAWATVERELSTLFWLVTQIKPAMAIKIFYSARSFKERADMFKAAIVAADVSDDVKTLPIRLTPTPTRSSVGHGCPGA